MKKIVFVIERLSTGGAERVVAALANDICERNGYEVYVYTYLPKEENEYYLKPKINRIEIPKTDFSRFRTIYFKYKFLRKELKKLNPYCVYSLSIPKTNVVLSAALRDRKFPLIISERNDPARFPSGKIMRILRNWTYRSCDGLVFQTPGAMNYFPKGINKKGVVISNPLTTTLPERYTGVRQSRIVNFCRIEPQKNLKLLINAFAKVLSEFPEYTLDIYGEGSEKETLKEYVKKLGIDEKVIFHNFSVNIHQEILKAAVFVSSSDFEGISNSMLEAMAIGIPTICTDCPPGGARATIRNEENGILVPVGSVEELTTAIKKVLSSEELMKKLSINSSKIKEELNVKNIAEKWLVMAEEVRKRGNN